MALVPWQILFEIESLFVFISSTYVFLFYMNENSKEITFKTKYDSTSAFVRGLFNFRREQLLLSLLLPFSEEQCEAGAAACGFI